MLKLLRKKGVMKKLLWVVAVMIILSFGVFGTANYLSRRGQADYAGKIFGRKVSFDDFRASMFHAQIQAILRYGQKYFDIRDQLDLESEAWDRLILLHEAKKRKIKIADDDVVNTIRDLPFFQTNAAFDQQVYANVLRYVFRCEPRTFEEGIRESLIFAKLFEQETAFVTISDEELKREYQRKNEQVRVSYILFPVSSYETAVMVNEQEIQAYYTAYTEEFRVPEQINVEYLSILYPADEQQQPDTTATLEQAQQVAAARAEGADLTTIAEQYNLELKESGYFSMEQPNLTLGWPLELFQKAFALDKGQVSPLIQTPRGFYLLRIKDKKDSSIPNYEEVQASVREKLIASKAHETARQAAEEYREKIHQALTDDPNADFASVAKRFNLTVGQTPLFSRGQYLEQIGLSKEFQETAFALSPQDTVSAVIEIPKRYAIMRRDSYVAMDEKKFEEEKEKFREQLLVNRKTEIFANFLARLRAKAHIESKLRRPQAQ